MATITYRIHITRGDYEFEVEGDKAFVLQMLQRFESSDASGPTKQSKSKGDKSAYNQGAFSKVAFEKTLSIGEFVRLLGVKRHTDLVVAFGYYLEHHRGIKEFTPADINNCYYEAKLEASNTSQMFIHNIRRGYMMAAKKSTAGGKKAYMLTRSGEEYIKEKSTKQPE